MKKMITLFYFVVLSGILVYAGGGWATSVVSLTKDGGSAYLYKLNDEGWTDGSWGSNSALNGFDFGTPTSLVLNGGAGNAWTDDRPGYDATSFVIYYRVYKNDATPGSWQTINLDYQAYFSGNNWIFDKANANIDVLALANISGTNTYTLEVAMSKKQMWNGGNWISMVPGGQETAYNDANAGYKASFVKTVVYTGISDDLKNDISIIVSNSTILAQFSGQANIELFTITGQLVKSVVVNNEFSENVNPGIYVLRVNGKSNKVLVK